MPRPVPSLDDCKRDADLLLKDVYSADRDVAMRAVDRLRRIAPFNTMNADDVYRERGQIQHKHALSAIAREHGYIAWKNLKDADDELWCPPNTSAFWHNWCKSHEEARVYIEANGGYLLTGHGKWFIAERGYIEWLGLDPDDPRWKAIGFDLADPRDASAGAELVALREARAARV
ncbi:MAG: hypothetical protein FJY92_01765 [Candidatus Hydrogenedentes bacterium]|nr:hypothetical protein [Candidatus Hydrogenedentota bacterium]